MNCAAASRASAAAGPRASPRALRALPARCGRKLRHCSLGCCSSEVPPPVPLIAACPSTGAGRARESLVRGPGLNLTCRGGATSATTTAPRMRTPGARRLRLRPRPPLRRGPDAGESDVHRNLHRTRASHDRHTWPIGPPNGLRDARVRHRSAPSGRARRTRPLHRRSPSARSSRAPSKGRRRDPLANSRLITDATGRLPRGRTLLI